MSYVEIAMLKVSKIGHATFETADLDRQLDYYTDILGLAVVDRSAKSAVLACPADHCSVVLQQGTRAGCVKLSLELPAPFEAKAILSQLADAEIKGLLKSDAQEGASQTIAVTTPDGLNVDLIPAKAPGGMRSPTGIIPGKLGHIAFKVQDVQKTVDFYVKGLGFRVSDWMGDFFAFLRCGPDHHTVNLLRGPLPKMHHIAFEADNWDHIRRASDMLSERNIPIIWGPGRHGIGHNIFIYHRNPDGQIVELYTELDKMSVEELGYFDPQPWHRDKPQFPKVWDPALPSNVWGPPIPDGFRD
jgi:catechol 2,3-dioxygenase-like lactoylglutathione lyase family enzyme